MFDCVCLQRIKPDIAQEKQIKQIFLFFFFLFFFHWGHHMGYVGQDRD